MHELQFTKGHGTGNDFVLFSDPEGEIELTREQRAVLCDRHFGIGADGIIRVVRSGKIPEGQASLDEDPAAEWFMDYYNADGSVSEMCGNGIRVFGRFLVENGLAVIPAEGELPIGTRAGVRYLRAVGDELEADLGVWSLAGGEPLVRARGLRVARPGLGIDVGNPHVVVALSTEEELDSADLAWIPILEPEPVDGANVEFVLPSDPLIVDGVGSIRMRVHERGSGETLSCGTGAVASAAATRHWAGGTPDLWTVAVPGGDLGVRFWSADDGEHASLSGPAELVYTGTVTLP